MPNTKPSTPFGKFFNTIGIWHPKFEDAVKDLFTHLPETEQKAITAASGIIAIVNANLDKVPDVVFSLVQQKFPDITKEKLTEGLNKLNGDLIKTGDNMPTDFAGALGVLQGYLGKYEGNTWEVISKSVVTVLANVFLGGGSSIQKIDAVLEFVYRNFIKGKVA